MLGQGERVVQQRQGSHPARQSLIAGLIGGRGVPRLHTDESGNHLQIVLYPMLQFAQLRVLFSNAGFERLGVQFARRGANERHKPVGRGSSIILDHIRM